MKTSTSSNLLRTATLAVLVCALPALAGEDIYGLGDGHNNTLGVGAANTIINLYGRLTVARVPGDTTLTLASNPGFSPGDLVLVLQTTGIVPEPASGGASSVDLSSDPVGRWELARLSSVSGTTLTMTQPLLYSYAVPGAQVIRVPEYTDVNVTGTGSIIARTWDGSIGGVVAFLATGTVNVVATITASSRGFRNGQAAKDFSSTVGCSALDEPNETGAQKGEGIAISRFGTFQTGRGRVANAAGGGVCVKAGGGGGGNGGAGGDGGKSQDGARFVGGQGGAALAFPPLTRLTLGGGGAPGHIRDTSTAGGGTGGGIVFIRANNLTGSGSILADGFVSQNAATDGAGGGGGGGTLYMRFRGTASCSPTKVHAFGGVGGSVTGASAIAGPGGGGGGGRILFQACAGAPLCPLANSNVTGGAGGLLQSASDPYGAQNGADGIYTLIGECYYPLLAPTVLTPANNSSTNDSTPTYTGTLPTPFTPGTEVVIYVDGVELTRVTPDVVGNWTFTPTVPLSQGAHSVYAVAVNTAQSLQSGPSNTNTFTVDSVPPAAPVVLTPANGSITTDNTPTYSGTAEANSLVTIVVDGAVVGTAMANAAGSWSFTPTVALADGVHSVKARATDAAGNTGPDSTANSFTVDTTPPAAPVVLVPANGSTTSNNKPPYSGTAEPGTTVTVIVDGTVLGTTTASGSGTWSFTPTTALTDGVHTVKARATDAVGNVSADSNINSFTVDTTPPAAPVVLAPANGSTTSNNKPPYSGTAEANSTVTIVVDGTVVGTATANGSGAWSFTPTVALADGVHMVKARAMDAAGNTSVDSASNSFTVDTTPPAAPVVLTPANGSTTGNNKPPYSGTAEPNSTVTIIVDGTVVGTAIASASGTWSFTPTVALADGVHSVRARATDTLGNTGPDSAANSFTVDTTAPAAPVVIAPANGSTTSNNKPPYSGTAEAGSTVTVIVDGMVVGTVTANGSGAWSFTPTVALVDGVHTVKARATDAVGNTGPDSASNSFTVDTTPPAAPVVLAPANGSITGNNKPPYSGTAEANSLVTIVVDGTVVGTATANGSGVWSFTPTVALTDGVHTVKARATDAAGNTSVDSATNTFTVDTTPPAAPVVLAPANGSTTGNNKPPYSGTAEANSTVTIIVDGTVVGTALANGSGAWSFTPTVALTDGVHTVKAKATDVAGNTSVDSATNTFTVDTTPPAAPVVLVPANGSITGNNKPPYSGTAEPNSTVTIVVDGTVVGTVTASASGTWSYTPTVALTDGVHMVKARATDALGNVGPDSATNSFTVDTTAPAAPVVTAPANGSTTSNNKPPYSGTAEANSLVSIIVDGTVVGTVPASASGAWSFTPTVALTDGVHTVKARATDAAGNISVDSATNTFTVDTSGPSAPVVLTPANGSTTGNNKPPYSGTAEPNSTVTIIVDGTVVGTATANGSGAWSYTPTVALTDGVHTVKAHATDTLGNTGPDSAANSFTVDTTAPAAPVVIAPANGSTTSNNKPPYSGTAEANSTVTVIVDGTVVGTVTANGSGAWSYTPTVALVDGVHTVKARATDAVGNTGPDSASNSFTVDTTAPAAPVVLAPANGSTISNTTPTYSGTAEAGSTVTVLVDGSVLGTTTANASGTWSLVQGAPLAEGSHTVRATATDAVGNTGGSSSTNTFIVDTQGPAAPVVLTPVNGSVTSNNKPPYTGTAEANSTVTIIVDGAVLGTAITNGSGAWSFTPTVALTDGVHTVRARATDAVGNTGPDSGTNTFTVDTAAPAVPVVTAPANGSITRNNKPPYSGTAEANSTVTVIIDGAVLGTTTANGSGAWSFTPTTALTDGVHTVQARATDAAGNTSADSSANSFTVDTTAPAAPVVTTPADGSLTNDNTPTYSGTAEANSTVTVIVDGSVLSTTPANASGAWNFTPTAGLLNGLHTVKATATDAAGNISADSATNSFTVDTVVPPAPVVLAPANGSATSDNTPTYSGTAEANSTVTVFVDGTSVGSTTANASGTWSVTPAASLTDGVHSVKATATDAVGNTSPDSSANSFTVDTTAPAAPVVTAPANGSKSSDNTPTYNGTAEPGSSVAIIVDGTVAGTVTANALGAWTLTPVAALADGVHSVKATATDALGNTSVDSNTNSFTVDTTAPAAPVVVAPANGSTIGDNTPTYTGTAEAGSTVTVIVDGSVVGTTTASASGTWNFTSAVGLSNGMHSVKATATDAVGNLSAESTTNTFTVDATIPSAPVVLTPVNNSVINDSTPDISGTSDANTTVTVFLGSQELGTVSVDASGHWLLTPTTPLAEGSYDVSAVATNPVGNLSERSNIQHFTLDTTPPGAPVVTSPVNDSVTNDNTPELAGTAQAGSTVTVSLNGSAVGTLVADGSGRWSLTPATVLQDGTYSVTATATDAAGNTSVPSATVRFVIDTVAPDTTVVSAPSEVTQSPEAPFDFGSNESNVTYECSLDGAAFTACPDPSTLQDVAEGEHTLQVRARDAAGNVDPTPATATWTYTPPPPDWALLGNGVVGCASTSAGPSSLALMGLALLLALQFRRREP